jgi:D-alanyl-lipoteichoic acid acyltransferase DltB (MBOAT superfamily)
LEIEIELPGFLLPLAISFYTFQQIGYIVDCYRGGVPKYGWWQYVLFVSFFPQLIAGPILRHKEIFSQYNKATFGIFSINNISLGFGIFALGLFKKTVIGDNLGRFSDALFAGAGSDLTLSFFESWAAALFFSFQIYFDFSGYSDMAVGLGRMFNIRLPFNFESPYRSSNIIDFWRRWHITLGRFLRSYLYIPLGGSRSGLFKHSANLLIVMCLGGIWHGAGWTFLAWGGYHGVLLMICHLISRYRMSHSRASNLGKESVFHNMLSVSATFLLVTIGWILFRAPDFSSAYNIVLGLLGLHGIIFDSLGNMGSMREYLFDQELFQQGAQLFPNDLVDFWNEGIYWLVVGIFVTFALPNLRTIVESRGLCFFNLPIISTIHRSICSPKLNVKLVLLATLTIFLVALLFVDAELEFLYFQF